MARIKIDLPDQFHFTTTIPVRITDVNYGGHVGNDSILSLLHEARVQFLASFGYSELDMAGTSLIMADVGIEFKNEVFYGNTIIASVTATNFSKASFEIYYKLEKETDGKKILVAAAKTGMVCFDYKNRKVALVPEVARNKMNI